VEESVCVYFSFVWFVYVPMCPLRDYLEAGSSSVQYVITLRQVHQVCYTWLLWDRFTKCAICDYLEAGSPSVLYVIPWGRFTKCAICDYLETGSPSVQYVIPWGRFTKCAICD